MIKTEIEEFMKNSYFWPSDFHQGLESWEIKYMKFQKIP